MRTAVAASAAAGALAEAPVTASVAAGVVAAAGARRLRSRGRRDGRRRGCGRLRVERARRELAVEQELAQLGGRAGQRRLRRRVERRTAVVRATGQHRRSHQPVVGVLRHGQARREERRPHAGVAAGQGRLHAGRDRGPGRRGEDARQPQALIGVPRGQVTPVDEGVQLHVGPGQRVRRRLTRRRAVGGRRQDLRPCPVLRVRRPVETRLDERAEVCDGVRRRGGHRSCPETHHRQHHGQTERAQQLPHQYTLLVIHPVGVGGTASARDG